MINKKRAFLVVFIFILLVGLISVAYYYQQNSNKISIENIDKYFKKIPNSRKNDLYRALYTQLTNDGVLSKYKSDATIRNNSISEIYYKDSKIYKNTFIIDIPSIKESFKINILWSNYSNVDLGGNSLLFSCLEKSEIIYSSFNCKKSLGLPEIIDDNIIQYLPYSVSNYSIVLKSNTGDKISLYIDIFLDLADTENNKTDASIAKYKLAAINWIKSKNLNPENYIINYRIHGN